MPFIDYLSFSGPATIGEANSSGLSSVLFDLHWNPIGSIVLILGIYSLFLLRKQNSRMFWFLSSLSVILLALGYFGSLWQPLSYFNPRRVLNFQTLVFALSISISFPHILRKVPKATRAIITAILLIVFVSYISNSMSGYFKYGPLSTEIPPHNIELIKWINENTPPESVILIEDTPDKYGEPYYNYYGGFVVFLFPEYTNRSFIAHYEMMHKEVRWPGILTFESGKLNKTKISSLPVQKALLILTKYNVDYIVSWNNESKRYFTSAPFTEIKVSIHNLTVYEILD